MMRKWTLAGIALLMVAISSCDSETTLIGNSLTDNVDRFTNVTDTFDVSTRSIKVDSVLSTSDYCYMGRIKDPETGSYITSDYSTQFNLLENEAANIFPSKSAIISLDENNEPIADSCFVRVMINAFQGDSLTAMKLRVRELTAPIKDKKQYYTSYDPEKEGLLRTDAGAINQTKLYSISDLTLSDSVRYVNSTKGYYWYINIPLNKQYTDKNGTTYKNYGTYLMRKFYEEPTSFKNFNRFVRNICPGLYFQTIDGQDLMCEIAYTQLIVYFRRSYEEKTIVLSKSFNSTQEVLQTTHITNDKKSIEKLIEADTCTYLKTPAGIYTEVTIPVDDIKRGHENDTLTSARISFQRMRAKNDLSDIVLEEPTTLLLVERDSVYKFFENNGVPDNVHSYLASFNTLQKTYTFNNISNLVTRMYQKRNTSENWNKAVLIPVQVSSSSTSTVSGVSNEMNINSVRLVGGTANRHTPVRISVIYNRNQ